MKKFLILCAAGAVMLAGLVSCGKSSNAEVKALVNNRGDLVALDVNYNAPVNPESFSDNTYKIPGRKVRSILPGEPGHVIVVIAGNVKNIEADRKAREAADDPGLEAFIPDVSIQQVAPLKTKGNKTFKPWSKPIPATSAGRANFTIPQNGVK